MTDGSHILLIATVGGTPDPLVASIRHWKPARIRFLPTVETLNQVEETIVPALSDAGLPFDPGRYDISPLDNGQDLARCVEQMHELESIVRGWNSRGDEYTVVVDFTGGTKVMSAALALRARRWRCLFSYIGGSQRNKNGVGTVESGSELTIQTNNPWDLFGYAVIERACIHFNEGEPGAAVQILSRAIGNLDNAVTRREIGTFLNLAEAYADWDAFNHKIALNKLKKVKSNLNDLRHMFGNDVADELVSHIQQHQGHLEKLQTDQPNNHLVLDLLANAWRCADRQRYDDAVARLYRAIEATAQNTLRENHDIDDSGKIPIDRIPEPLRNDWQSRATNGLLKLGLQDDYALLKSLNDPLADKFTELKLDDPQRSPLVARNASILAHGFQPIGENAYKPLWEAALKLADLAEPDLPRFPKLPDFVPCAADDSSRS